MAQEKKFYLISFSDSNRYRYETTDEEGLSKVLKIEKDLNDYLKRLYPEETFAYFTSPRVTEISWEHRGRYMDYAPLDGTAVKAIKEELAREIASREAVAHLDDNAPYSKI